MKDFIPILVCGLVALILTAAIYLCTSSKDSRYANALKYAVEDQVISPEQYNKLQIYLKRQGIEVKE